MKHLLSIICAIVLSCTTLCATAQYATDYQLIIDKNKMGSGCAKINCQLTIDYEMSDSLVLDFGGNLQEESVDLLDVSPSSIRYKFDPIAKQITFYRNDNSTQKIELEYVFANLTAILMYEPSVTEIWETIYTESGEFYYPSKRGMMHKGRVKFLYPDSITTIFVGECHTDMWYEIEQCVAINFAFLSNTRYEKTTIGNVTKCDVYQLIGEQANSSRIATLEYLATNAITWMENVYNEGFIQPKYGTQNYPTFIFHNGNSMFNRYNMGFISASQEKFATATNIYPLVHEIGHRWLGEYTMFIDSGERGYAWIIETLNEFMTLMCIRDIVGIEAYEALINDYEKVWEKIKDSQQDIHPVDVKENNNITVTYRKGPVLLERMAREVGYERLIAFIAQFYNQYKGNATLSYDDFEALMLQEFKKPLP